MQFLAHEPSLGGFIAALVSFRADALQCVEEHTGIEEAIYLKCKLVLYVKETEAW